VSGSTTRGTATEAGELTPEEEAAIRIGLDQLAEEKVQALRDPGPSWREWFFFDAAKWWVAVAFLVLDSWVVGAWIAYGAITTTGVQNLSLSLGLPIPLETLLYLALGFGLYHFGSVSLPGILGLAASLVVVTYLELLTYLYLWRRPSEGPAAQTEGFRPGLLALREYGRWTPEAAHHLARHDAGARHEGAPNAREFL